MVSSGCESPKHQGRGSVQGEFGVTKRIFEEIGAQINLEFEKRCGPRCPGCNAKLPGNKSGRRAVMDSPMPHVAIFALPSPPCRDFPIEVYQQMLERIEDAEDIEWLKNAPEKLQSFRMLAG
jgi:hypothetical protein